MEEAVFPGGKGVNVSLVLSELGMDTCCCGFLAGATGKAYEAMLEERGLKAAVSVCDKWVYQNQYQGQCHGRDRDQRSRTGSWMGKM